LCAIAEGTSKNNGINSVLANADCIRPPSERWSFNVDFFYTCIDLHSDMSSPFGDYGDASSQLCIDMQSKFRNTCCNLQVDMESPPSSMYIHTGTTDIAKENINIENEDYENSADDDLVKPDYYNEVEETEREDLFHRYWPGGERGGTLPTCNLCASGNEPRLFEALINPFMLGPRPCKEVYEMGRLGYIPPEFCESQQLDLEDRCGCGAAVSPSAIVTVVDVIGTDDPAVDLDGADFFGNTFNSPPLVIDSVEMPVEESHITDPQQQQTGENSSTTTNNDQPQQNDGDERNLRIRRKRTATR
jgi:hypothetical protein